MAGWVDGGDRDLDEPVLVRGRRQSCPGQRQRGQQDEQPADHLAVTEAATINQ
jgi:hypothetical protein